MKLYLHVSQMDCASVEFNWHLTHLCMAPSKYRSRVEVVIPRSRDKDIVHLLKVLDKMSKELITILISGPVHPLVGLA